MTKQLGRVLARLGGRAVYTAVRAARYKHSVKTGALTRQVAELVRVVGRIQGDLFAVKTTLDLHQARLDSRDTSGNDGRASSVSEKGKMH